jgi:prephenate dehydratase
MPTIKVAYFGHPGSFSFKAAKKFVSAMGAKAYFYPCQTAREVMDYVLIGECYGVLPSYNSHAGGVKGHIRLVDQHKDLVVDEVNLPVHHCLAALHKLGLKNIKRVYSHRQALLQCADYLKTNLPQAELIPYATTSTAAYDLAHGSLPAGSAVIASKEAAEIYKLKVLASGIEDSARNVTNFKVLFKKP